MAFTGSVPQPILKVLSDLIAVDVPVSICCSGNFSIEQALVRNGHTGPVFSNDVSMYTTALAHTILKKPFRIAIKEPKWEWLAPYLSNPLNITVTLAILLGMLERFKNKPLAEQNAFVQRRFEAYRKQFDGMHEKSVEKFQNILSQFTVDDYFCGDGFAHAAKAIEEGRLVCSFPPTWGGGYENLYKLIEQIFDWDKPEYTVMKKERYAEFIEMLTSSDDYLLGSDQRLNAPLLGVFERMSFHPLFLYGKIKKGGRRTTGAVVNAKYGMEPRHFLRYNDEPITKKSRVAIMEVGQKVLDYFRAIYLKAGLMPEMGSGLCFLLFVDGKLFGFLKIATFSKNTFTGASPVFITSSFCVPSKFRIAKLMSYVMRSKNLYKAVQSNSFDAKEPTVRTAAFTHRPAAMMYRGVMKIKNRGVREGRGPYLTYEAPMDLTMKQVVLEWVRTCGTESEEKDED